MEKWIFVCTGNTCRSPMAEKLAQKISEEHGLKIEAISCGVAAQDGEPANASAIEAMSGRGLDLSAHRAQAFDLSQCDRDTLILTMTGQHKQYLTAHYPNAALNIYTLMEYAGSSGDILDPYGGSGQVYEACVQMMEPAIAAIVKKRMEDKK